MPDGPIPQPPPPAGGPQQKPPSAGGPPARPLGPPSAGGPPRLPPPAGGPSPPKPPSVPTFAQGPKPAGPTEKAAPPPSLPTIPVSPPSSARPAPPPAGGQPVRDTTVGTAGEVRVHTMQEDLARLGALKEKSGLSLPPSARSPEPLKPPQPKIEPINMESPPPLFTPEAADVLIAASEKEGRQRQLVRIGSIVVAVILLGGGIGFAAYRWLLPALRPEVSAPQSLAPQPSPPSLPETPETPPPSAPSAPALPAAFLPQAAKQAALEISRAEMRELQTALALEPTLGPEENVRELAPRIAGETAFLTWSRFVELFFKEIGAPAGFGGRLAIFLDKGGRALVAEVSDESQAAAWLEGAEAKLAPQLTFLLVQPSGGSLGAFRAGRPVSGVSGHRFAINDAGQSLDYGFAGKALVVASHFNTFTRIAELLSQQP